jgi:hypothetical protein
MDNWAFSGCKALTSVYITDLSAWCNITFGSFSNPLSNDAKFYVNNEELTELVIPDNVKRINDYAFDGLKSLTKVSIGTGVTSIGKSAFSRCSSLASVHITDLSAWCKITFSDSSSNPLSNYGAKFYLNNNELTEDCQ